jgi:hypothetical protein
LAELFPSFPVTGDGIDCGKDILRADQQFNGTTSPVNLWAVCGWGHGDYHVV